MAALDPVHDSSAPWKVAVAVRSDLEAWQKLNVTAFVTSGIGTVAPHVLGDTYEDGSGREYPAIVGVPIRVYAGEAAGLRRAFDRALGRDVIVSVYTEDLFATMNDEANRAAVRSVATADLNVAGFVVAGPAKQVDKVFDKLRPHP